MLNTPTGMRWPEENEHNMLTFGAIRLTRHIAARIRSEERKVEHEGVILKAVRGGSPFHALNPRSQMVLLHCVFGAFFDPHTQNPMTQFWNAALECVYSCLLYEVKAEIDQQGGVRSRHVKHAIYYAWETWFHGMDEMFSVHNNNLDDWVRALDLLAARSVFDQNYARQFDPGYLPDITDQMVMSAATYFEGLHS